MPRKQAKTFICVNCDLPLKGTQKSGHLSHHPDHQIIEVDGQPIPPVETPPHNGKTGPNGHPAAFRVTSSGGMARRWNPDAKRWEILILLWLPGAVLQQHEFVVQQGWGPPECSIDEMIEEALNDFFASRGYVVPGVYTDPGLAQRQDSVQEAPPVAVQAEEIDHAETMERAS